MYIATDTQFREASHSHCCESSSLKPSSNDICGVPGFPSAGFVWYPRILMAYYHLLSCSFMFHIKWPSLGLKHDLHGVYHIFRPTHMAPSLSPVCLGCAPKRSGSPEGDLPPCEADCDLSTLGPNQTAMVRAMMVCPTRNQGVVNEHTDLWVSLGWCKDNVLDVRSAKWYSYAKK